MQKDVNAYYHLKNNYKMTSNVPQNSLNRMLRSHQSPPPWSHAHSTSCNHCFEFYVNHSLAF